MATKQKQNRFLIFLKASWAYIVAGILIVGIGVTMGIMAATSQNQSVVDVVNPTDSNDDQNTQTGETENSGENQGDDQKEENSGDNQAGEDNKDDEPASTEPVSFALPMKEASVIVDYTDTKLVYNPTLDRWESHFYIDLSSSDNSVFSVLSGEVLSVEYDYLTGYVVKIQHEDGLVSVYGSLGDDVLVQAGDSVSRGQKIGNASNLAASSSKYGEHLEFTLLQNDKKIDPNNYLDLQNK